MGQLSEKLTNKEKIFLAVILLLGLALRLSYLDHRPFHHDESLNAIYGKYFFENNETGFYKYNPLVHGPLLYNLQPYVYEIFGASIWSARMPMVLMGFFLVCAPFLFRRFLSARALIFLVSLLALSPSLIYWSRFVREDALVFMSYFGLLYGLCLAKETWKPYWVLLSLSLHYTCKENIFVTLALLAGYLFYEWAFLKVLAGHTKSSCALMWAAVKRNKLHTFLALILAIFVFCFFYSAGFRYAEGILDGLYRKSFLYWFDQHQIERIKGPFAFQFLFLTWYEFPFVIFFFLHLIHFYFFKERKLTLLMLPFLALALGLFAYFQKHNIELSSVGTLFKMKIPLDGPLLIVLVVHALIVTSYHLYQGNRGLAFCGYFFMANFFTYSYLGEKVPWLSQYILYPGLIYLALYLDKERAGLNFNLGRFPLSFCFFGIAVLGLCLAIIFYVQPPHYQVYPLIASSFFFLIFAVYLLRRPSSIYIPLGFFCFLLALGFNLRNAIMTNFTHAGAAHEFIGQVHTSRELHQIALDLKKEMDAPTGGVRPKILVTGLPIWPLNWYFHGYEDYKFYAEEARVAEFDYVFDSEMERVIEKLGTSHRVISLKLRGWWVPNYEQMTLVNYLNYLFWHHPWNEVGHQNIVYAVKK